MRLFNKVAIIGTGLIGGSLALAMKRKGLAKEIVGVSRHKKTLSLARRNGAIDRGSQDLGIIKGADLVVLATPVDTIIELAPRVAKLISPKAVVIDVGSTKEEIVRRLSRIFPRFVGTHPLAGSQKRGIRNAQANLFKNSLCILTPLNKADSAALNKIKALWVKTGAKVVLLSPKAHDNILSLVSHLPHIAAFSLINTVPAKFFKFAPSSLKDATRIAASDPRMWQDVFLSNKRNILQALNLFQDNLIKIKSAIQKKDKKAVFQILKTAKAKRENLT